MQSQKEIPTEGTYIAVWFGKPHHGGGIEAIIYSNHYSPVMKQIIFTEYNPIDMRYTLTYLGASSKADLYIPIPSAEFNYERLKTELEQFL